jgi:ribose transport system substrate-binding protein
MSKLKFVVSLMTDDNDYQIEQANNAAQTAQKLGVDCQILYAGNDAVTQSTQILKAVQSAPDDRPNAIIFEPVGGTALPQAARSAVNAGIGWAVLNREVDYISELRRGAKVPVFGVNADQFEVGRIQARQSAALLPGGGTVLYLQGPSDNPVAKQRFQGMQDGKPANIHLIVLKGQWTEDSAVRSVTSWLRLSTSRKSGIDAVVSQNDAMAIGVRKAFQQWESEDERERWLQVPFLGVDGVPKTGQAWVRDRLLTATIFTPPTTGRAIELMETALKTAQMPAERILSAPSSIPAIEKLRTRTS